MYEVSAPARVQAAQGAIDGGVADLGEPGAAQASQDVVAVRVLPSDVTASTAPSRAPRSSWLLSMCRSGHLLATVLREA